MILEKTKTYTCEYCKSKYTKEKTLIVHMCEQKRRYLAKTEKHVVIGYQAFNKFYQFIQKNQENKTYDEFARSPYYNAFVKFGSFVSNINPLYPEQYIDWTVRSGVKLDHWCRDQLYEKYVLELIKEENVETALERSIKTMTKWAETHDSVWSHYFKYVSVNRAVFDIKDGKISPWLILNSTSGREMLNSLVDDQLASISNIIDPVFWAKKFKTNQNDLELVKQIVKESNL
jgi:hypothetical protein